MSVCVCVSLCALSRQTFLQIHGEQLQLLHALLQLVLRRRRHGVHVVIASVVVFVGVGGEDLNAGQRSKVTQGQQISQLLRGDGPLEQRL